MIVTVEVCPSFLSINFRWLCSTGSTEARLILSGVETLRSGDLTGLGLGPRPWLIARMNINLYDVNVSPSDRRYRKRLRCASLMRAALLAFWAIVCDI